MKNYILTMLAFSLCLTNLKANDDIMQADTVVHYGNKIIHIKDSVDQVKVKVLSEDSVPYKKVYEGIFASGKSYEKWTVQEALGFNIPFVKRPTRIQHDYHMEAHWAGLGWGFTNVADENINIGNTNGMDLKAEKSNEFYMNLIERIIPIYRNNLGLTTGFGMTWRNYFLDNNLKFQETNGITEIVPSEATKTYRKSRLRTYTLTIPLMLEWQPGNSRHNKLFVTAGVIGGVTTFSSYKIEYSDNVNGGTYEGIAAKWLNVNPLSLDYFAQAGLGNISVFAKYAAFDLFQENKGPKVRPVSLGLVLHF